ncbi:hypothetical protein [Smaragdicoccus niigatensis]|uniref:hypothetical protein n=1 Tax=Smaragdicoccus niigatensis TaxID=359359 RepID=UPI00036EEFF1|nr:hypothetical protein [Smaragdicoccus niigatensis]
MDLIYITTLAMVGVPASTLAATYVIKRREKARRDDVFRTVAKLSHPAMRNRCVATEQDKENLQTAEDILIRERMAGEIDAVTYQKRMGRLASVAQ